MDAIITRVKNTAHDANVPCSPQKGWVKETFAEHSLNEISNTVKSPYFGRVRLLHRGVFNRFFKMLK